MPKPCRIVKYLVVAGIAIALIAAGIVAGVFLRALPDYAGHAAVPGLSAAVDIYRDEHGVPHIFANTLDDAARALGYVHASERMFQMEMQRRAGQGRLAEVAGPAMLGVDKFIRTLGLYPLAASSYAALSPEAKAFFEAYASGVNAWLATHRHALPPEFLLLHIKPDAWKPADSIVWGKLMGLQLSHNYRLELLRAQLAKKLTPAQMNDLFPMPPEGAPVTTAPHLMKKADAAPAFEDPLDELGAITGVGPGASNEWVIAGSRTASGKPILANDPHLDLAAPILWYLARIVTPGLAIKGATVPGLPVVLLGQNDHIAWGFTTTGSDVEDLFIETVDPGNPDRYLTPGGSAPFETRTEIIHVKGAQDVVLKVRATRHGPVLSDIDPDMAAIAGKGKVIALAFTGLGARDTTSESLMRLNRARNWHEFLDALKLYQTPPQNVVYADRDGNIGFINPGLVPVRASGDGLMPADGASGAFDWTGTIPFGQWTQIYNPRAGFVFNANNAIISPDLPHFLGSDWEEPYRAMRLQQFFDSIGKHTLDTSASMQADHVSLAARQLLPYLLQVKPADARAAEALQLLKNWDGTMDKDRPEPLIFEAWLYQLHRLMLADKTGSDLKDKGPYAALAMADILASRSSAWCAASLNKPPANCDALVARASAAALDMLAGRDGGDVKSWRWGHEHIARLQNKVFSRVPVLGAIAGLDMPSSGSFYTLDRGGSPAFDPAHPFARTQGGGYRGIYDLGNPANSRFMIATGESGNPASRHYGDLAPLWNAVKSFTLSGTESQLAARGLPELVLEAGR